MLSPKRSKYRKAHKGRVHGLAKGGTTLNFGAYGLKASKFNVVPPLARPCTRPLCALRYFERFGLSIASYPTDSRRDRSWLGAGPWPSTARFS